MRGGVFVGSDKVGGGPSAPGGARGGVGRPSVPPPYDPMAMVGSQWRLLGHHMSKFRLEVSCEGSKSMTMGPWIHGLFILTID